MLQQYKGVQFAKKRLKNCSEILLPVSPPPPSSRLIIPLLGAQPLQMQFKQTRFVFPCRPSYYELQIDGGSLQKQKSSGLCVSTGTGSTAWSFNICRLHPAATEALIKVVQDVIKEKNKLFQFQFNQDVIDKGKFMFST